MDLKNFPNLSSAGYTVTSPADIYYNCIAWAVGDIKNNWWPHEDGVWPPAIPLEPTIEAFVLAFATFGYEPCDSTEFEHGYEKIALYVDAGEEVTHAARQLRDGEWTSKLGHSEDITHTLDGLVGPLYGQVRQCLRRSAPTA